MWSTEQRSAAARARGAGGFRPGAGRGKKSYQSNIRGEVFLLRSSYETKVACWLNARGILWIVPPRVRYVLHGQERWYYPDFLLPEHSLYIETKNRYLLSQQIDKMVAVRASLELPLRIISNDEIDNLDLALFELMSSSRQEKGFG